MEWKQGEEEGWSTLVTRGGLEIGGGIRLRFDPNSSRTIRAQLRNATRDFANKMSHTVTVTRTTTSTTTSAIILNTGYLKTLPGLLKVLEVVIAAVCLGMIAYYSPHYFRNIIYNFFSGIITTALVASLCLLLACLMSLSTASIIAKTNYEVVFHTVMFILTFASSVALMVEIERYSKRYSYYHEYMIASILGFVLCALYLISAIFAYRSYRGL